MTRTTYWLCFSLVLFSVLLDWSDWLFRLIGKDSPYLLIDLSIFSVGSLVPHMFSWRVHRLVRVILDCAMLLLLLRRSWLFFSKKERVPSTFQGLPKVLGYVGAFSFIVSVAAFPVSIALRIGSGVYIALLMLPALICVPWSFFLAEVHSFLRSAHADAQPINPLDDA